jgi:uncharacterized protein YjbI with pentapeptide repeats
MAHPEHVEILKQGVEVWNDWRQHHTDIIPSLDKADLKGANLQGALLFNTNIRWTDLTGANLRGAVLFQAELFQSCLRHCGLHEVGGWTMKSLLPSTRNNS